MLLVVVPSAPASADCMPIVGTEHVLEPGTVVLLGEIHGTRDGPETVSRLACAALEQGRQVTVGLEIPQNEQSAINRYLEGEDEASQRDLLLATSFWRRDYQDGRSSRAMLDLLFVLREYGTGVVAIDDPEAPEERDAFMAHRLSDEISKASQNIFVVLVGNLHNRLVVGNRFNASYEPMGYLLRKMRPETELISLQLTHSGGSAWICTGSATSDCGERALNGKEGSEPGVEIFEDSTESRYSGRLHVGPIEASPPAKN